MRACGPFSIRKSDIIAAAQATIHAVHFAFVERTIQTNGSDSQTALLM